MANIIITESQLVRLKNRLSEGVEVLRGEFTNALTEFLKSLAVNPINPTVPTLFTNNNISKEKLITKLIERGIVTRNEGFDEVPNAENGKKFSVHKISYKICGQDFDEKKDRLYDTLFRMNEDGEMGGGALGSCNVMAGTSDSSGGVTYPFGGIQRRGGYNSHKSEKDKGDVTKQESNVDMTPALKRDKKNGISMNRI